MNHAGHGDRDHASEGRVLKIWEQVLHEQGRDDEQAWLGMHRRLTYTPTYPYLHPVNDIGRLYTYRACSPTTHEELYVQTLTVTAVF